MTEIASLKISVDAREAKNAVDQLNKMPSAAGAAEKSVKGVSTASSALNKVLGITAGYLSARKILQAAEDWTTLNNRLRLVTDSQLEFNAAQEDIFRIAQDTRQGLTATAELYQRIATNQDELNITGKETADIVQTINQALVISGTSGAGASAALVQLGQAFASGTLRGEELNSVLEQAPALAQAIARGMGVTVGQLRALGADGVLTATAVIDALQNQSGAVESQFSTIVPTVSGALTQLDNSFINLIGRMDDSTGASARASEEISKLADLLSDPKTIESANQLAAGLAVAFAGIIKTAGAVIDAVRFMAEEAAALMHGVALDDAARIADQLEDQYKRLASLEMQAKAFGLNPDEDPRVVLLRNQIIATEDLLNLSKELSKEQEKEAPVKTEKPEEKVKSTIRLATVSGKLTEEQKKAEAAAKANASAIDTLKESIYQASLSTEELAKRQAEIKLNEYATPEQIAQIRSLGAELQKLEDVQAAKDKFGDDPAAEIRGTVTPLSGGAFDDQVARYEAEREAEEIRYQEQQERLAEALNLQVVSKKEAMALEEQFYREHSDRLNQIDQARTDMLLQQTSKGFSQMSSDIMEFASVYAKENKAMFAISKASAIASTIISTYESAQDAYKSMAGIPYVGPALGVAAAAAAVGAGMARVSAIQSQNMSFEGGGFTGSGSRSGGMDGKGGFMAMVHPNETIIDHTKGQSSGGGVTVNVIESSEKAGTQEKRSNADGTESVDVFVADIFGGGQRGRALESVYGLQRVGR